MYNSGEIAQSIEYHLKNLEFTDKENAFAGFYNLGISYRAAQDYESSISSFENALQWSKERKVSYPYILTSSYHDISNVSSSLS